MASLEVTIRAIEMVSALASKFDALLTSAADIMDDLTHQDCESFGCGSHESHTCIPAMARAWLEKRNSLSDEVDEAEGKEEAHFVTDVQSGALGSTSYTCNCGEVYSVLPDGPGSAMWRTMDGRQPEPKCRKAP